MKDFIFLKLLDILRPIITRLGVDYSVLRKILQVKLILNERRVPTIFANSRANKTEQNYNFLLSLGLYALMGLVLIPFILIKGNYIYQMSIVYVIVMFFIMTSLISDFSSVLMDLKDKNVIGIRPVNPKTISLAKTILIFYYLLCISAALTGPSLIISLFRQGFLFFIIFLVSIIFINILSIVLTSYFYFFILKFLNGEMLKDIINYVQIILSLVIMVGYQFVVRLFDFNAINTSFIPKWWHYFIIPFWYSVPFQIIREGHMDHSLLLFLVLAVAFPILLFLMYINVMPKFEQNLQKLNNYAKASQKSDHLIQFMISRILCPNNEERIFFRNALNMMKREREFKLKVYPSLGYSLVVPFIFFFQYAMDLNIKAISQGNSYYFIYFTGLMMPTLLTMIRFSENYQAAWIYKALPIANTYNALKGAVKAAVVRLFLPLYLIETVVFTIIFGTRIVPDLIVAFLNILIFTTLCIIMDKKHLPFSKAYQTTQHGAGMWMLVMMFVLCILAGLHFLANKLSYGIYIFMIGAFLANIILWKIAFHAEFHTAVQQS